MLLHWRRNGGLYSDIVNEYPLRSDVADAIEDLNKKGKKFLVHCWESAYDGYSSSMGIIDDQTLEEYVIDYQAGYAPGKTQWWISVFAEYGEEFPGCGYHVCLQEGWTIRFE